MNALCVRFRTTSVFPAVALSHGLEIFADLVQPRRDIRAMPKPIDDLQRFRYEEVCTPYIGNNCPLGFPVRCRHTQYPRAERTAQVSADRPPRSYHEINGSLVLGCHCLGKVQLDLRPARFAEADEG